MVLIPRTVLTTSLHRQLKQLPRRQVPGGDQTRRPRDATLRNLAIAVLHDRGWTNIAKALRHHARNPL